MGAPPDIETTAASSDSGGVEHGERVRGELPIRICGRVGRSVGCTIAATVERDHGVASGKVRNLSCPEVRMHHRPRREKQDRAWPVAEDLVVDAYTVSDDEPFSAGHEPQQHVAHPIRAQRRHAIVGRTR